MSNKIIGTFYFKKTQSGNLIGEFTNNGIEEFIVECANIKKNYEINKFDAKYITTWLVDFDSHTAELEIVKTDLNYILKWYKIKSNKVIFEGTAIVENDVLIGKYNSK